MKAMTVVQFANWLNVISSDMTEARGGYSVDEDRTLSSSATLSCWPAWTSAMPSPTSASCNP